MPAEVVTDAAGVNITAVTPLIDPQDTSPESMHLLTGNAACELREVVITNTGTGSTLQLQRSRVLFTAPSPILTLTCAGPHAPARTSLRVSGLELDPNYQWSVCIAGHSGGLEVFHYSVRLGRVVLVHKGTYPHPSPINTALISVLQHGQVVGNDNSSSTSASIDRVTCTVIFGGHGKTLTICNLVLDRQGTPALATATASGGISSAAYVLHVSASSTFGGHRDHVRSLDVNHETQQLFVGSDDCSISVWDMRSFTPESICSLVMAHGSSILSLYARGPELQRPQLLSGSRDGSVILWEQRTGKKASAYSKLDTLYTGSPVVTILDYPTAATSPSPILAVVTAHGEVRMCQVRQGTLHILGQTALTSTLSVHALCTPRLPRIDSDSDSGPAGASSVLCAACSQSTLLVTPAHELGMPDGCGGAAVVDTDVDMQG